MTFDIPTARDNLPSTTLTVEILPADITSPYLFNQTTDVSYTFTDQAGNSVTCTFRVYIFGKHYALVNCKTEFVIPGNGASWLGHG